MRRALAEEVMSAPVVSIRAAATILHAVRTMRTHAVSGLPVVDEADGVVGVITEGDILFKEAGLGGYPELAYLECPFCADPLVEIHTKHQSRRVAELMSPRVVTASPTTTVREIARLMNRHRIDRVPIVHDGRLVGLVTRADILSLFDRPPAALLADLRSMLQNDLLIDPNGLDIVVKDGDVTLGGGVADPRDIGLIEAFIGELEGVCSVDVSGLKVSVAAAG